MVVLDGDVAVRMNAAFALVLNRSTVETSTGAQDHRSATDPRWEANMKVGMSILLITHGILAVLLLGAITHQAIGAAWPVTKRAPGFWNSLRSTNGMSYTNAVAILFLVTFVLGLIIYPTYRVSVRTLLQEYHFYKPEGAFELKEHLLALSLALLPIYWLLWRRPSGDNRIARVAITSFMAVSVWWSFITGHVLNNIRGFGS
jgi:hypothetical protein